MTEADEVRPDCPECGKPMAKIVHGLLCPDEETLRDMNEGRIAPRDCIVMDDEPTFSCGSCDLDWWPDGRTRKSRDPLAP